MNEPQRLAILARLGLMLLGLAAVVVGRAWAVLAEPGGIRALGTLRATDVTITSEVSALIREVLPAEGQIVRTGDPLVRLDDDLLQLQYRMAGPAEQQTILLQLPKYKLLAPVPGVVLRRDAEPGEIASPGSPLLVIADLSRLHLTVHLSQRDLTGIHVGQPVFVEAETARGEHFPARVSAISASPDFIDRNPLTTSDRLDLTFPVKIQLNAGDPRLRPGVSALAHFEPTQK
jgi:multidrug resistance efflux pump